jgi:hypothetical protein
LLKLSDELEIFVDRCFRHAQCCPLRKIKFLLP